MLMNGNAKLRSKRDSDIKCVTILMTMVVRPTMMNRLVAAPNSMRAKVSPENSNLPTWPMPVFIRICDVALSSTVATIRMKYFDIPPPQNLTLTKDMIVVDEIVEKRQIDEQQCRQQQDEKADVNRK